MAYAATPAAPKATGRVDEQGRAAFRIAFTEAEVAAGSTIAITGLPETGTVTLQRNTPTFTTGATVQPSFGKTIGFVVGDANYIGRVSVAAAFINEATSLRYSGLVNGTIYYRTTPNAGADTTTTVILDILEGHWP